MMERKWVRLLSAVGVCAGLSCSDGSRPISGPGPILVERVEVSPATGSIAVGATLQLSATARDASGNVLTGRIVSWSSDSPSLAIVSPAGLVTGDAPGLVTITATSEGRSATAQITVTPAPVATIEVSPDSGWITVGHALQLSATTRDAAGNVLTDRDVSWSSDSPSLAMVSSAGLVTGEAPGLVTITATSEGRSATAEITVTSPTSGRSLEDRPDDTDGPQIHVMYVLPSDGHDRRFDVDGTLARSVSSFHTWFTQRSNGLAFRFDTFQGELDITYHRLSRTDAQMIAFGAFVVTQIERELQEAGRLLPNKLYIVYYDGGSTYACGGAAWPPQVPGRMAAMYLRGTPGGAQCGAQQFVTSETQFPRYWEFAMLHDLVHVLGVVAVNAPNHMAAFPGHVPERNDLMYGGSASWVIDGSTTIDVGGDDYFGANVPANVAKLADSPFVTTVSVASLPRLGSLSMEAALELSDAFRLLPPHPPFRLRLGAAR
jgi:hypothetical protein